MILSHCTPLQLSSVFGSTTFSSSGFYWMVIDLNFTDVVPDECSSPDDYFQWIPTDEVTSAVMENGHNNGLKCRLDFRLISRVEQNKEWNVLSWLNGF